MELNLVSFILKTLVKKKDFDPRMKMVITISYGNDVVLDHTDAVALIEILERAERYESKYRSKEEGGPLIYVYTEPVQMAIKHLPQAMYDVAKMAGRPPEKD